MKRGTVLIMALTLVVGGACVASAQGGPPGPPRAAGPGAQARPGGPGGGRMRRGGFNLLESKEVQQELKMTPAQVTKLQAALQQLRPSRPGGAFAGPALQPAPGKGPAPTPLPGRGTGPNAGGRPQVSEQDREQRRAAQEKAIASVLNAKQLKRYHELEYQRQGATALSRPEVAAQLKLTDSQKKQVASIIEKARDEQRSAMQGVNFQSMSQKDRQALFTRLQTAQKATNDKLTALLTATQKKQWTAMQGAPFKFPTPAPRNGAPGPGTRSNSVKL